MKSKLTVSGRGAFPVDMLRYDAAWPVSSDDAMKISRSISSLDAPTEQITLYSAKKKQWLTPGRWRSFGWDVVSAEKV